MRRGDIIVNPWVSRYFNGELNPNYATIYLGDNKSLDYTGKVCEWAVKVYKDNPDRMTPWKVIGHIDLYGIAELAIRDAVFDEENKDEPNSSEKPNNCEHITEDGVTCTRYPACDDCLDNPLNKVKGSERLVKGSEVTTDCRQLERSRR